MDPVKKTIILEWLTRPWKSKGFFEALVMMVIIIGALSWYIYQSTDEVVDSEIIVGTFSGLHQMQTDYGSAIPMFTIKLESGDTVVVQGPPNVPVRQGARVRLAKGKTRRGKIIYGYAGFEY